MPDTPTFKWIVAAEVKGYRAQRRVTELNRSMKVPWVYPTAAAAAMASDQAALLLAGALGSSKLPGLNYDEAVVRAATPDPYVIKSVQDVVASVEARRQEARRLTTGQSALKKGTGTPTQKKRRVGWAVRPGETAAGVPPPPPPPPLDDAPEEMNALPTTTMCAADMTLGEVDFDVGGGTIVEFRESYVEDTLGQRAEDPLDQPANVEAQLDAVIVNTLPAVMKYRFKGPLIEPAERTAERVDAFGGPAHSEPAFSGHRPNDSGDTESDNDSDEDALEVTLSWSQVGTVKQVAASVNEGVRKTSARDAAAPHPAPVQASKGGGAVSPPPSAQMVGGKMMKSFKIQNRQVIRGPA